MGQKNLIIITFTWTSNSFLIILHYQFAFQFLKNIFQPKSVLIKDSEEEKNFINNFIASICTIHTSDIHDENSLENIVQTIA